MIKRLLKFVLLIFLISLTIVQVGFLLNYYLFNPDDAALASASTAQNPNIVLTSCATEDLSVAVSKIRTAVVYITGKKDPAASIPTPNTLISFAPTATDGDKMGSGIILDADGYILTNFHVVSQIVDIQVSLFGIHDQRYPCQIVSTHPELDLAVIKISTGFPLPAATLGDSDRVEIADSVLAVGCPFNLEQSVSHGIISDTKRTVDIDGRRYFDLLQTDAVINSGNSGGALVNIKGEVIGVNVAIYAPSRVYCGVGFAIAINKAKPVLMEIPFIKGDGA